MARHTEPHSTYIPPWLDPLLSDREYAIITHKEARNCNYQDGEYLPSHQTIIKSPLGEVWIDSQKKMILSS